MKNYIQPGTNITVTAAAANASGDGVLIGTLFGFATGAAAIGESVTLVTSGVFITPKLEAQAWTVGAAVYWDAGNARATTVVGTNTKIGVAVQAAADPSTTGVIKIG